MSDESSNDARPDERAPESSGQTARDEPRELPVVALGASAGGLQPLEEFFDLIPHDTGAAFVIIQHLSPDFESMMDQLLVRHTVMDVTQVTDGMSLAPDRVHLIPRDKEMRVEGGCLWLTDKPGGHHISRPIDIFFESLGRDRGPLGIALVISGTGSDGAKGAAAVRDSGGVVYVQDPDESQFDGMPRAVIGTGEVDEVLPISGLVREVTRRLERISTNDTATDAHVVDPDALRTICTALRRRHGIDFLTYKRPTVSRRLKRRLIESSTPDLATYAARITSDESELDQLYQDLLIGVSSFFRDPDTWRLVQELALPELFGDRDPRRSVRAWVAGCATGQEAFTLGILLHEAAREHDRPVDDIKIFATDANPHALAYAGRGTYTDEQIEGVPDEFRRRYFTRHEDHWQVSAALRGSVVFARHDLLSDPPFTQIDILTCRNLLIYLKPPAQQSVLERLRFALTVGGYMLLGPSEHVGPVESHFEVIDRRERLYRLHTLAPRSELYPQANFEVRRPSRRAAAPAERWRSNYEGPSVIQHAYQQVLDRFVPACLLLDASGQLVHIFGEASRFLELGRGRARLDVLRVVRHSLRGALSVALHRLPEVGEPIIHREIYVDEIGEVVDLRVERLDPSRSGDRPFVIVGFITVGRVDDETRETERPGRQDGRITDLQAELDYTREHLSATTEELTASNEELQSTNEELLAANEELQSTNEELHSVNEELYTVNTEFRRKNLELTQLNADIDNLLKSSAIGAIFLDERLRIRKFTPAAAHMFNLLPRDHDRPLGHLRSELLGIEDLLQYASQVRDTGEAWQRTVTTPDSNGALIRILPYRDERERIGGVVVTLTDVSQLVHAQTAQAQSERRLGVFARNLPHVMWLSSADTGEPLFISRAFRDMWGFDPHAVDDLDARVTAAIHPDDLPFFQAKSRQMQEGKVTRIDYRIVRPDGEVRWLTTRNYPVEDEEGEALIAGLTEDVTDERSRRALVDQLRREKERAAAVQDAVLSATTEQIFMLDDRGECTFANQAALTAWGRTAQDVVGETLGTLGVTRGEDDVLERLFDGVLRSGRSQRGEDRIARGDDDATIEYTLTPVRDARWRVSHVVVVARDITQRADDRETSRKIHQRLRALVDASDAAMALVEGDEIVLANAVFSSLFGRATEANHGFDATVEQQGLEAVSRLVEQSRRTGGEVTDEHVWRHGGRERLLAVRVIPAEGESRFVELRVLDVAPVSEREQALTLGTREIGALLERLTTDLDIALDSEAPAEQIAAALATARQAAALARSLDRNGERDAAAQSVDLAALAHEITPLLSMSIPSRTRLVIDAPTTLPAAAIEPHRARQLLMSLIVHTAELIPPDGTGTVRLRVRSDETCVISGDRNRLDTALPDGPCLTLDIGDDGPGLSASDQRLLFTRVDHGGAETNLGLDVAQVIVRQSGGAMSLDACPGGGCTLRVALPLISGAEPTIMPPDRLRVLTASPDPGVSERVRAVLGDEIITQDTDDALTALRTYRVAPGDVHLAVIDAALDGPGVVDLIESLQALDSDLAVLVLGDDGMADKLAERGIEPGERLVVLDDDSDETLGATLEVLTAR